MRQRLGLAQALLGDPRLLLLDEPTSGLDPALRRELYGIVAERARAGATVLLSSHALTELEGHAERVIVLNRGRKIADGTLEELRALAGLPSRLSASWTARRGASSWARTRSLPCCARSWTRARPGSRWKTPALTTSMPISCNARPPDVRDPDYCPPRTGRRGAQPLGGLDDRRHGGAGRGHRGPGFGSDGLDRDCRAGRGGGGAGQPDHLPGAADRAAAVA
nr:AAA family ATPase [Paracoccus mutanolyticus]